MAHIEKHQEKSLGELLLQGGKITKEQLEQALSAQQRAAEPIGKTLVRLGFVKESDVLQVLKGLLVVSFTLVNESFAMEALYVREIIRYQDLNHLPKMPSYVEGILRHREMVLPVINLAAFIGKDSRVVDEETRIIIIEKNSRLFGIRVDAVEAVIQLPIDRIESTPAALKGLDSKYIYGVGKYDGKLITVLHIEQLFGDRRIQGLTNENLGVAG